MEKEYSLTNIYLNLTERCNLRCRHCWISPYPDDREYKDEEITIDEIKGAVKDAMSLGLRRVKFTGGEPFLRREIIDIIKILKDFKILIDIETNGTLIDKAIAKRLKELKISFISVSIDGAKDETHDRLRGIKGSFKRAIEGIEALIESGLSPQIIFSLYKGNISELEDTIYLVKHIKASSFKINPILPSGRGKDMVKQGETLDSYELISLTEKIETIWKDKYSIPIIFDIPIAFISMEKIKKGDYHICNIHNILGILADGNISICGIGKEEKDLVMGSIRKDNIKDIWMKSKLLISIRDNIPKNLKGICKRCILKKLCLGCCVANNYTLNKDLFSPYYICKDAYENGLFPKSRLI
jgi:SynChlorMet cassette radical SAM/SPASM protein ScmF